MIPKPYKNQFTGLAKKLSLKRKRSFFSAIGQDVAAAVAADVFMDSSTTGCYFSACLGGFRV